MITNNNPRADAANIVMNNPKLQKMITEALEAPLGSTKRQRAKAALDAINKSSANRVGAQDGQGGIMDEGLLPWAQRVVPSAWNATKNVVGGAAKGVMDYEVQQAKNLGQVAGLATSGMAGLTQKAATVPKALSQNAGAFVFGPKQTGGYTDPSGMPFSETTGGKVANTLVNQNPLGATILTGIPKKKPGVTVNAAGQGMSIDPSKVSAPSALSGFADLFKGIQKNPFTAPMISSKTAGASGDGSTITKFDMNWLPKDASGNPITTPSGITGGVTGGATDSSSITTGSSISGSGEITDPDAGSNSAYPILQQLADQRVGGAMAWNIIASDEKKWAETFPGVPWPGGATLSGQTKALFEAKKKAFDLDDQQKALLEKQAQGATIEEDFNSYLHGKDTYIKELDGMIDANLNLMATTDMSDPFTRQQMSKYMDYLYLMKGKQLKSYAGYVSESLDQYNAEVKNMGDKYDADYKNFLEEYSLEEAVTTEKYNMYKDALTSLYDNLANQEEYELKMSNLRNETLQTTYDTGLTLSGAKDSADAAKREPMTEQEKTAYYNAIGLNPDGSYLTDKKGNAIAGLKANPDLYSTMANMDTNGFIGDRYKEIFLSNIPRDVSGSVYSGNIYEPMDFYKKTLDSIDAASATGTVDPSQAAYDKQVVSSAFLAGIDSGVNSYMKNTDTGKASNVSLMKTALNDLTGKGFFSGGSFGTTDADRKKWVDRQVGKGLSKDILEAIFTSYKASLSQNISPQQFLSDLLGDGSESNFISNMSAEVRAAIDPTTFKYVY